MQANKTSFLALHWPVLKQAHFHWFWGLTYKKDQYEGSLGEQALALLQDKEAYRAMKVKHEEIHHYNKLVRWIYWLFNIENYTSNGFILVSCSSYMAYQTFLSMEPIMNSEMLNDNTSSFFQWWNDSVITLGKLLGIKNFEKDIQVEMNQMNMLVQEEPEEANLFVISPEMQRDLYLLGIEKQNGESLAWKQVKHAYHKKVLREHPDKGGSEEAFRQVHASYKTLEGLVFPEKKDYETTWYTRMSPKMAAARMESIVKEARIIVNKANENSANAMEQANKAMEQANKAQAAVAKLSEDIQQLKESLLKVQQQGHFVLTKTALPITQLEFNKTTYCPLFYPIPVRNNHTIAKNQRHESSSDVTVYCSPTLPR